MFKETDNGMEHSLLVPARNLLAAFILLASDSDSASSVLLSYYIHPSIHPSINPDPVVRPQVWYSLELFMVPTSASLPSLPSSASFATVVPVLSAAPAFVCLAYYYYYYCIACALYIPCLEVFLVLQRAFSFQVLCSIPALHLASRIRPKTPPSPHSFTLSPCDVTEKPGQPMSTHRVAD